MGGNNLDEVVQVTSTPKPDKKPELKLGTEAPKKRKTRMIDVDIR